MTHERTTSDPSVSGAGPAKTRVLLVDDHPIVRSGLAQLINQQDDLCVCGEAEDAHVALEAIAELNPDMAIVDVRLKTSSGIDLIKDIRARFGRLPVLVLSMHEEALYAERALRAGAQGYIMKQESGTLLLSAVRRVLSGHIYVSADFAERTLRGMADGMADACGFGIERLSDRELEVFRLMSSGLRPREIADRLHLSVRTVESYFARIKQKLNLKTASELSQHAIEWARNEGGQ